MKKFLLFVSIIAMVTPFTLEFLLDVGVLKEYGSTIEQRQAAYATLMYSGLIGMIFYLIIRNVSKRKLSKN